MTLLHARISHWAFWEDRDNHAILKTGTPNARTDTIDDMTSANLARSLKPAWRRRLDLYGRAAAEVLGKVLVTDDNPHIVFASRHGNIDRTLKLLHQVATDEILSPANFSMSVHNALVGIASINWSITQSHTAIAAGADSLISGLTETLCQLADHNGPVVLCYVDLPLPEIYADIDPADISGIALAMRFCPLGDDEPAKNQLAFKAMSKRDDKAPPHQQARQIANFLGAMAPDLKPEPKYEVELAGKTGGWLMTQHD
ncbi:beta-ketoacyl synthase chain length factor [Thalassospira alkalitolerans]|uniref:beta-ketoacyl synthase chain length factor n=1 Tax=Thalassospira alkalitolerans TaxID=1293890 RepID=UPI000A1FCD4F|nr:beta-ketoacyl synthase chain length factor [Thalassospira alkalitolerans]|tara:strand:- start:70770 stop:71540 length:771 start_codon:yes stop_codon:yes gene_type:complete